MNAVELDVGNLKRWLAGATGVSGPLVDNVYQNGYVLYFSDRRGMLPSIWGTQVDAVGSKTGDSGFEDVINSSAANGTPDGALDPIPPNKPISPEDVNENGHLDNFGPGNLGLGLGYVPQFVGTAGTPIPAYVAADNVNRLVMSPANPDPYLVPSRIPDCSIGAKGWVSGARHVLKLVDGTLGNLPILPALRNGSFGGFTVGSENPVYIYGNYNSNAADPIWNTPAGADQPGMSAGGIVADAVTVLSNNWSDVASLHTIATQPTGNRNATTTYYRVAVAGGKNINFPFPAWSNITDFGFGTDGGVHNFLRFLENWGGVQLNYEGSLVSLYYSTYNTGTFKCCSYSVYFPPVRNYIFDPDFTVPAKLPPGTPLFRDIDNLSYRQNVQPRTSAAY
jgi:hypothetical protein